MPMITSEGGPMPEQPMTANDVATLLSKTPEWVLKAARNGDLPSRKIGQSRRFLHADIEDYLERVRTGAQAAARTPRQVAARTRARRAS